MDNKRFQLRSSPFVFLKWLVVIEYSFSVLPLLLIALLDLRSSFETLRITVPLSFDFLVALVMTAVQVLIIGLTFAGWYFPVYEINPQRIVYRRGGFLHDKTLAEFSDVTHITLAQGAFGRRFDYGTIELHTLQKTVVMKDMPDPERLMLVLEDLLYEVQRPPAGPPDQSILELLANGENQFVEYKSSLNWDYRQQRVNKELVVPVMKNVAGFMNSMGGVVLIGVSDEGEVLGLQADFDSLRRGDADGFENHFNNQFSNMIGLEYRHYVQVAFPEIESKLICMVTVRPGDEPVFLRHKGQEEFYIRAGNGSRPLSLSKATRYIQAHFQEGGSRPANQERLPVGNLISS